MKMMYSIVILVLVHFYVSESVDPSIPSPIDCAHKCPVNISIIDGNFTFKYGSGVCECDKGWTTGPNNECIMLAESTYISYPDALALCQTKYSARLLSIKSEEKQKLVESYVKDNAIVGEIWLDANRINKVNDNTAFTWADGTKFTYTLWSTGEPNNDGGNEYCVKIWRSTASYVWDDTDDLNSNRLIVAICEKSCS